MKLIPIINKIAGVLSWLLLYLTVAINIQQIIQIDDLQSRIKTLESIVQAKK